MINRHNYEEFFLLYIDKELDAKGQAAVDAFVSQNPDLAGELELLQQATLGDDNIQFKQKEILYKKENSISLNNYEEYFLLFMDKELNEQQAAEVESFVLKHPHLQNEFTLLQQIKLQPEIIAFAGKEKLYRKEKKIRRTPLTLIRMGAAAAIAGVVYISFIVFGNARSNGNIAVATAEKPVKRAEKNDNELRQNSAAEKPIVLPNTKKENKNPIKHTAVTSRKQGKSSKAKSKETQSKEAIATNKMENNRKIPTAVQNMDVAHRDASKTEIAKNLAKIKNSNDNENSGLINNDEKNNVKMSVASAKEERPVFTHAVYIETENVEQEKSTYIGSAEINKTKLKSFFKKAAAFFDKKIRRNNNNDN